MVIDLNNVSYEMLKEAEREMAEGRYCTCLMEPEVSDRFPSGTICPFCIRFRQLEQDDQYSRYLSRLRN